MSRENVEVVRQSVVARPTSRRTPDEALAIRLPRVAATLLQTLSRLWVSRPPSSRIRRLVVQLYARRAAEALNRRDLDLVRVFAHPDIEAVNTPDLVALGGFEDRTQGRDAFIEGERNWEAQWKEFRYEPNEVIDLGGHRFLMLGRVKAHGSASGVVVDSEWGLLVTTVDGLVIREQNFLDRGHALEAVGLRE